ncbi:MAG: hypothetical protein JRE14_16660 [Deltaproteobacteria bacterium]|nr:hypothetical protein [Deltaproteobacteria bacterium]
MKYKKEIIILGFVFIALLFILIPRGHAQECTDGMIDPWGTFNDDYSYAGYDSVNMGTWTTQAEASAAAASDPWSATNWNSFCRGAFPSSQYWEGYAKYSGNTAHCYNYNESVGVECLVSDSDGDGIPDTIDPQPNNPLTDGFGAMIAIQGLDGDGNVVFERVEFDDGTVLYFGDLDLVEEIIINPGEDWLNIEDYVDRYTGEDVLELSSGQDLTMGFNDDGSASSENENIEQGVDTSGNTLDTDWLEASAEDIASAIGEELGINETVDTDYGTEDGLSDEGYGDATDAFGTENSLLLDAPEAYQTFNDLQDMNEEFQQSEDLSDAISAIEGSSVTASGDCAISFPFGSHTIDLSICGYSTQLNAWGNVILMLVSLHALLIVFRRT